jgi:hypothetical protein
LLETRWLEIGCCKGLILHVCGLNDAKLVILCCSHTGDRRIAVTYIGAAGLRQKLLLRRF